MRLTSCSYDRVLINVFGKLAHNVALMLLADSALLEWLSYIVPIKGCVNDVN